MKNRSLYCGLIFCLAALPLSGQNPFLLKGKLDKCAEQGLFIAIENRPGLAELDTIKIEADGSFFYENKTVTRPHQTSIQRGSVQFNDIYITPGYELTLTANVEHYDSLVATRRISGIGAAINRYQFFLDSMALQNRDYEEKPYLKEDLYYSFHKVLSLYQGEVRNCALVSLLISHIRGSRSLDALNDKLTDLEPFLGEIQGPNYLSDFKQRLEKYRASLP